MILRIFTGRVVSGHIVIDPPGAGGEVMLAALVSHAWESASRRPFANLPAVMADGANGGPGGGTNMKQRMTFMAVNGISFEDTVPASYKLTSMPISTAVAAGLIDEHHPLNAVAPAAGGAPELRVSTLQKYGRKLSATVRTWFSYDFSQCPKVGAPAIVEKWTDENHALHNKDIPVNSPIFQLDAEVKHAFLNEGLDGKVKNAKKPSMVAPLERTLEMRRLEVAIVTQRAAQNWMIGVNPEEVELGGIKPDKIIEANAVMQALVGEPGRLGLPERLRFDARTVRNRSLISQPHTRLFLLCVLQCRSPCCVATCPSSETRSMTSPATPIGFPITCGTPSSR